MNPVMLGQEDEVGNAHMTREKIVADCAPAETTSGREVVVGLGKVGILIILWVVTVFHVVLLFSTLQKRTNQRDFVVYYLSALELREGVNPYRTDFRPLAAKLHLDPLPVVRGTDPPTFLLCFEPLTLLSPKSAYWTWAALNVASLVVALFLLLGPRSGLNASTAWMLVALALWYVPVGSNFYWGQSKLPILLMLVLMMCWMERGYDGRAGLILAFAGLLRAFPLAIAGYLILKHRWRMLMYTVLGVVLSGILTIVFVGVRNSADFVRAALYLTSPRWLGMAQNFALGAFVSRLFWWTAGSHLSFSLDLIRRITIACAYLAVLALTVRATIMYPPGEDPGWRALSLWVVTAIILSPTTWMYDMVLVLIPLAQLASAASRGRVNRWAIWAAAASYLLLYFWGAVVEVYQGASVFSWTRELARYGGFTSLALVYVSAYLFAVDRTGSFSALTAQEGEMSTGT